HSTESQQKYYKLSCSACWTDKVVLAPGPVGNVTYETALNGFVNVNVTLPVEPNGPIDGLWYHHCPVWHQNCVLRRSATQLLNRPMNRMAILRIACDEHCLESHYGLCIAAHNVFGRKNLFGPSTCYRRTPLSEGLGLVGWNKADAHLYKPKPKSS